MAATVAHEVFLVPQQFLTIQAAIDAARGRTTIVVAPEVYAESLSIRDKQDVVIQSALLTRRGVTISGDGGLAVLCVERSSLHLSGVEIRSNACNRGLWVMNSSLSLQDSIVAGNRIGEGADELFGAGMYCRNSSVRIQKTTIVGNVVNGGTAAAAVSSFRTARWKLPAAPSRPTKFILGPVPVEVGSGASAANCECGAAA